MRGYHEVGGCICGTIGVFGVSKSITNDNLSRKPLKNDQRGQNINLWPQKCFFSTRNENWEVPIGYVANMK